MKIIASVMIALSLLIAYASYKIVSAKPMASWHMVNVNSAQLQGDANLIIIKNQVIMIDAGYRNEANNNLLPYLRERKINRIHHFFVSHPHKDHYQGLGVIVENGIKVDNLYFKIPPKHICDRERPWGCDYTDVMGYINGAKSRDIKVHNPKTGFRLALPNNSSIEILHAQEDDLANSKIDANDLSLIMKWSINGFDVLFTGDLNHKLGTHLTTDARMASDFLKMPHHGGRSIAPNSFFDTVSPKFILVPGPKWLWCGERADTPRRWVYEKKLPHWVNGLHGNISVDFNKNGGKIYREKNDNCLPGLTKSTFAADPLPNPYPFN